jgi:hypothetical protein
LDNAPLSARPSLDGLTGLNQLRPLHAGLDFYQSGMRIELKDPAIGLHVEVERIHAKLLAPHRMTSTSDGHTRSLPPCLFNSPLDVLK